MCIGAPERDLFHRLSAVGREPQSVLETKCNTEDGALCLEPLIHIRRAQRACGRQLLVRKPNAEAARVILPHLGIGVGPGGPISEACNVHCPDIGARIAMNHPVSERQPDTAALAESRHDAAGHPVVLEATHRPDYRISVRSEGEWSVDYLFDAGPFD